MIILVISITLIITALLLLVYNFFRKKGARERILSAFEQLATTMPLENTKIQYIPSFLMNGTYRTFSLAIEAVVRKLDGKKKEHWRIITKPSNEITCRFYVQSESQEGKLRKVVDLEVVTTGDEDFDKEIMIFSGDAGVAHCIFNPYMRQRFLWAGFKYFSIEITTGRAIFETYAEIPTSIRAIRHQTEVFTEFLNAISLK